MKFFIVILIGVCLFSSCNNKYENLLKSNTAEVREFIMEGKSEGINASLVCGMREKDYKINGYATELIEFGVLTFEIENIENYDDSKANYVLFVGTNRFDGILEKNPFNGTLVADIKQIIDREANVIAKIIIGEFKREIRLNVIGMDWKVDVEQVYEIVASNFKAQISTLNSNNIFNGEVYIKILNDADIYKGDYYWYVSIISRKGGTLSMIISPYSKEILAINDTLQNFED